MALRLEVPSDPAETHVRIAPLRRRQLRSVLKIEAQVYPRPWTLGVFTAELAQRSARCYLSARVGSTLVGYCGALYTDLDAHVTNIAVDPAWHRHQIGSRLMCALIRQSLLRGANNLTLEVRVSNTAAQEMYRRFGMTPAGVRRKYYENTDDALVMWANDISSEPYRARLRAIEQGIIGTTQFEGLAAVEL